MCLSGRAGGPPRSGMVTTATLTTNRMTCTTATSTLVTIRTTTTTTSWTASMILRRVQKRIWTARRRATLGKTRRVKRMWTALTRRRTENWCFLFRRGPGCSPLQARTMRCCWRAKRMRIWSLEWISRRRGSWPRKNRRRWSPMTPRSHLPPRQPSRSLLSCPLKSMPPQRGKQLRLWVTPSQRSTVFSFGSHRCRLSMTCSGQGIVLACAPHLPPPSPPSSRSLSFPLFPMRGRSRWDICKKVTKCVCDGCGVAACEATL
mmetsp:Transcript_28974/g.51795  ORF Transcript_28974/g.51795 Transcript_28974/m.51795 type:complete len:261 (+) Transcript_28974:957-1739(+)